jgi:hypothetical protein
MKHNMVVKSYFCNITVSILIFLFGIAFGILRTTKISYQENLFIAYMLIKNIIWLKIMMHYTLRVNVIEWDANHGKNPNNILFWKMLLWIFSQNSFKASITLFHDNAWSITFIFDSINYLADHRVIL